MLAHRPHPELRENPVGLTLILGTAALATIGVVGFAAGHATKKRREEAATPKPTVPGLVLAKWAVQSGGGPGMQTHDDEYVMRHNGLFTTFFTREVEQEVISRLQAYRNKHQITGCKNVSGTRLESGGLTPIQYRKFFREGEAATREILTDLYPTGAPWDGDQFAIYWNAEEAEEGGVLLGSPGLWRWWLWNRVNAIADWEVCQWKPVT